MDFISLLLVFLFLFLIIFAVASLVSLTIFTAPWVPSSKKDILRIFQALEIKKGDIVYDLGSGDGRIILAAAKSYPIKRAVGIELSILLYIVSLLRIWISGLSYKVAVKLGSFYRANLSEADIVICYLFPKEVNKLSVKFKKELRPGTRIASLIFPISGWQPEKVIRPESGVKSVFVYKI